MQGAATKAMLDASGRSGNAADGPAPPQPLAAAGFSLAARRPWVGAQVDRACRVDDGGPGNPAAGFERAKGVTDHPRLTRQAREPGDLAIRRHAAARNPRDHGVDPLVPSGGRHYNLYIVL